MNPLQKKLLRDALLAGLATAAPVTLPIGTLAALGREAGFRIQEEELESHLAYLVSKGLVLVKQERLSAGVKRWEITGDGVDYAEGAGLV